MLQLTQHPYSLVLWCNKTIVIIDCWEMGFFTSVFILVVFSLFDVHKHILMHFICNK